MNTISNFLKPIFILLILGISPILCEATLHLKKPKDFHPTIEAAGCFLDYEGKFLVLHRQDHKPQGDLWGFPGGKLDENETSKEAVIRETYEETHIDISNSPLHYVRTVYLTSPDSPDCIFHIYYTQLSDFPEDIKISFKEHKGYTWITPEDALKLDLMRDEEKCIELVYRNKTRGYTNRAVAIGK